MTRRDILRQLWDAARDGLRALRRRDPGLWRPVAMAALVLVAAACIVAAWRVPA